MKRRCSLGFALLFILGYMGTAAAQDEMPKDDPSTRRTAPAPPMPKQSAPAEQNPSDPAAGAMSDQPFAVLQALDKITARVRRISIKVGEKATFGTLSIEADACRKAPPEDPPESAAFLKIMDAKPGVASQQVFSGWMFASSPALSAMDHPVYDIWVVDCASEATASAAPAH